MASAAQDAGRQLKNEELPVYAIVQSPLLAIRWQLPNLKVSEACDSYPDLSSWVAQVRRVQLRFALNEDFNVAYDQLFQLGLKMSTSRLRNAGSSSRISSPGRPASTQVSPPGAAFSTLAGSRLSCPPNRLAEISGRPYTATNAPTAVESQVQEAAHGRPVSAFSSSKTGPLSSSYDYLGPLAPPVYFKRPTSATSNVLGKFYSDGHERLPENSSSVTGSSHGMQDDSSRTDRPSTAELLLPPRRELPFKRSSLSSSPRSDSDRPLSRPLTSPMGPPPLPLHIANSRPTSSRDSKREVDLPPLPQPTVVSKPAAQTPRTPMQSSDIGVLNGCDPPSKGNKTHYPSTISSAPSPSPAERSNVSALPTLRPSSSAKEAIKRRSSRILADPVASKSNKRSLELDNSENLSEYAKQPGDVRRDALNEFIYYQLQSEDFLTLVEDMETCWARITSGKT